ncbi:MAG: hypothetical protein LLG40_11160 [Deltaproteobacteria bacterium]|nr:hypothetical protein [Deltaproteobacteria bacterium]
MGRRLCLNGCEMTFYDKISDTNITLFYDLPETEDRIKYQNEQVVREGNKIKSVLGETRQKYGLKILTGFKKGNFENAAGQPISSDKNDKEYDPNWKKLITDNASDIIEMLAVTVFEVPLTRMAKAENPT